MSNLTTLKYYSVNSGSCGYCHQEYAQSSSSYGIVCTSIKPHEYEKMMLISFRRSGDYFYKPVYHTTCCPQYTIRLDADEFSISKSQKKVLKRLKKEDKDKPNQISQSSTTSPNTSSNDTPSFESFYNYYSNTDDKITIEIDKATFTEEKFNLYKDYQIKVHKDLPESVTPDSFTRFLCDSPIKFVRYYFNRELEADVEPISENSNTSTSTASDLSSNLDSPPPYLDCGSFHHLYRYEGKLIGVGVVDVLPSGISSVYFFYDSDLNQKENLNLGKYSSLREISFAQNVLKIQKEYIIKKKLGLSLNSSLTSQYLVNNMNSKFFRYYYLGFYIHNCTKMVYKREYKPSQTLCPYSFKWVYLDPRNGKKNINGEVEETSSKILEKLNQFYKSNFSNVILERQEQLRKKQKVLEAEDENNKNKKLKKLNKDEIVEKDNKDILVSYSPFTLFSPLYPKYSKEFLEQLKNYYEKNQNKIQSISSTSSSTLFIPTFLQSSSPLDEIVKDIEDIKLKYVPKFNLKNPNYEKDYNNIVLNINNRRLEYGCLNEYGKEVLFKYVEEISQCLGDICNEFDIKL